MATYRKYFPLGSSRRRFSAGYTWTILLVTVIFVLASWTLNEPHVWSAHPSSERSHLNFALSPNDNFDWYKVYRYIVNIVDIDR